MTISKLNLSVSASLLALVVSACSQGPDVSIGDNSPTQTKTGLEAYIANWVGYAEAKTFMDGTDMVQIAVAQDGTGTIRFGNRELWPPASNPNAVYPPDFAEAATASSCPPIAVAWDGFLHPLRNLRVELARLRASVASDAVFESWCKIQQPIALASGGYACINSDPWVPGYGPACVGTDTDAGTALCVAYQLVVGSTTSYEAVNLPCMQASLCYDHSLNAASSGAASTVLVCTCTASGCQLGNVPDDVLIDAALDDAQQNMTGTLAVGSTNYTIRLKRQ